MTNTIQFSSQRAVIQAVTSVGLAVTPPVLAAIQRNCKEPFLGHLAFCVQKDDADGKHRKYLEFLLKCLDPETLAHIQDIVPDATVDEVTVAAKSGPVRFMSVLSMAMDASNERHQEAVEWMKLIPSAPHAAQAAASPPPEKTQAGPAPAPAASTSVPQSPPRQAHDFQRPRPEEVAKPTSSTDPASKHQSHHVYGSSYALCFNAATWREESGVMVDAAISNGPKSYDWKNAVHVWLSPVEVAAVVAVFRKWRKGVEFAAHGSQNDKSFAVEFQGAHFFAKISAKVDSGKTRAVKIMPCDATAVSILFLKQLGEAYKGIPLTELLATVRATHQMENAA